MTLQDFKRIFTESGGSLSPDDLVGLADFAPDLPIGVKVGYGSRFVTTAANFRIDLKNNIKYHLDTHNVDQYVREVFIPVSTYDKVKELFGWPKNLY
jgi:hypothetical protein